MLPADGFQSPPAIGQADRGVADIVVSDDALGSETLTLSGADSAFFELRGNALYFIGASPNFEAKASYAVTVEADDPAVGGAIDAQATFMLNVTDVNEAPVVGPDFSSAPRGFGVAPYAFDPDDAVRLWDVSLELLGRKQ